MIIEKGYMLLVREGETHVTRIPMGNGNPAELLKYYEAKGFRAWERPVDVPELPEAEADGEAEEDGTGLTGVTEGPEETGQGDAEGEGGAGVAVEDEALPQVGPTDGNAVAALAEKYQARPKRK